MNLGTMVYVIDAVDDIDEDNRNGTFNPFLQGRESVDKETFIRNNVYGITDMMRNITEKIQASYSSIRGSMGFHHGIADNVIFHGIPASIKKALCGCSSEPGIMNMMSSRLMRRGGE
jgi:hypothetical protein